GGPDRAAAEPPGDGVGGPRAGAGRHRRAAGGRPRARPVQEGALMDLTNDDVYDILALLDSLPYDELDLQTPRFRLTLRRPPDGWTQNTQVLSAPNPLAANAAAEAGEAGEAGSGSQAPAPGAQATTTVSHRGGPDHDDVTSLWLGGPAEAAGGGAGGTEETDGAGGARAGGVGGLADSGASGNSTADGGSGASGGSRA